MKNLKKGFNEGEILTIKYQRNETKKRLSET